MRIRALGGIVVLACLAGAVDVCGQVMDDEKVPVGARVFMAPMDGFETYLAAALREKKVQLVIVADRQQADFEITGSAESRKAGWARTIALGESGSNEQASISVANLKTSVVAFAYSVSKSNSDRGKQSTAEACAKRLKAHIEGK